MPLPPVVADPSHSQKSVHGTVWCSLHTPALLLSTATSSHCPRHVRIKKSLETRVRARLVFLRYSCHESYPDRADRAEVWTKTHRPSHGWVFFSVVHFCFIISCFHVCISVRRALLDSSFPSSSVLAPPMASPGSDDDGSSAAVCCMCGDHGLPHELFRCNLCRLRLQHRYRSSNTLR